MLKSIAPVKILIFALNKSSPSWDQAECGEEQSYWLLLLGPGCSFGLVMGKRLFLGLCEGACQGAMGSSPLDGSMRFFRGS